MSAQNQASRRLFLQQLLCAAIVPGLLGRATPSATSSVAQPATVRFAPMPPVCRYVVITFLGKVTITVNSELSRRQQKRALAAARRVEPPQRGRVFG